MAQEIKLTLDSRTGDRKPGRKKMVLETLGARPPAAPQDQHSYSTLTCDLIRRREDTSRDMLKADTGPLLFPSPSSRSRKEARTPGGSPCIERY